jgi:hypothetical protein
MDSAVLSGRSTWTFLPATPLDGDIYAQIDNDTNTSICPCSSVWHYSLLMIINILLKQITYQHGSFPAPLYFAPKKTYKSNLLRFRRAAVSTCAFRTILHNYLETSWKKFALKRLQIKLNVIYCIWNLCSAFSLIVVRMGGSDCSRRLLSSALVSRLLLR